MIKIKYPKSRTERTKFENEYKEIWQSQLVHYNQRLANLLNSDAQYTHLNTYTFEHILTAPFDELQNIASAFAIVTFSDDDFRELKSIFNYDYKKDKHRSYGTKYSDKIANFFRDWTDQLNLCTCYFCNIDFINTYSTLEDHMPLVEFLNTAEIKSLEYIDGISNDIAGKIFNKDFGSTGKTQFTSEDDLLLVPGIGKKTKEKIVEFYTKKNEYGNFTLDHLIDKGKNPVLALSLYNFVPSCYVCNSKVKTTRDLVTNASNANLSPTHKDFNFNKDAGFKLILKEKDKMRSLTPIDIKDNLINSLHLNIEAQNGYNEYIGFFRIKGRYKFHKKEAIQLVELKKKYSKSHLNKISKLLNNGNSNPAVTKTILKDIFGKELFEGDLQDKPLTKLKRDIAKQIGIQGVKDD